MKKFLLQIPAILLLSTNILSAYKLDISYQSAKKKFSHCFDQNNDRFLIIHNEKITKNSPGYPLNNYEKYKLNNNSLENFSLFAVFAGHGKSAVISEDLQEQFYTTFYKNYKDCADKTHTYENIKKALQKTAIELDEKSKKNTNNLKIIGSTITCLLLYKNKNNQFVWLTAHAGNSGVIILPTKQGSSIHTTVSHDLNNQKELKRVFSENGVIINGKLGGQLKITRSIGDYARYSYGTLEETKKIPGLTCELEISKEIPAQPGQTALVFSDGLINGQPTYRIFDPCYENQESSDVCKAIMACTGTDNTTAIVIKYKE
ncbi:MAG: PP2C family protein-serine/threonine phosphatase [bacterium]